MSRNPASLYTMEALALASLFCIVAVFLVARYDVAVAEMDNTARQGDQGAGSGDIQSKPPGKAQPGRTPADGAETGSGGEGPGAHRLQAGR